MSSPLARLGKKQTALLWAGIGLLGLGAGYEGGANTRRAHLADLADEARRGAAVFTADVVQDLRGSRADLPSPAYLAVKGRLDLVRAILPGVRAAALLRPSADGRQAAFLADSAAALPGDDYFGAARSPALQRLILTNLPSAQGPDSDAAGTWALGFALVPAGSPRTVLSLDVSAEDWSGDFWAAALRWTLFTWLVCGLPFGALLITRSQKEQRKAIRNLLGAMEQSHSAVMIVDLDDCIEYANASLCAQIGYSRRELLGRPWRDFQAETPAEVMSEMVATVRAGNPWRGEWFNRRRNGEVYPVRGAISPVKSRDGGLACFVAVFEDMTEFKRSEGVLRAALDRAEAGDRAKSQFLATMSHEVRTPLNGIVGFTSLLLEMSLSAEQREYIQIIRASGEALIQLTGDILDFAHIESGALKLEPRACDPRACVEEVLDLLAVQAAGKHIELLHWVDEDVPDAIVADEARLRQVLANLAGNAVKFTEAGEVAITVQAERAGPGTPARLLKFSVRDTGDGIPAEHHEKLFKPFNQVDVSITRRHGGTGLGLAISKNLVQLMGGTIAMESAPGAGSTFSFTLPVSAAPGVARPRPDLAGLTLALAARPGPFRAELARLARRWNLPVAEFDSPAGLAGGSWGIALVEVDAALAHALASAPADPAQASPVLNATGGGGLREVVGGVTWPADRAFALVPVSLSRELRTELRKYFRQVVNKPVHHDALLGLLAGTAPAAVPEERPASRFELSVLVAEDNPVNQRLAQKLLWNLGCTSTLAANGRLALEELARAPGHYDLVLMDLHMPEMDGQSAIERIRAGAAGDGVKSIWIAAVTADARGEQKERILAAGGNDYVVKPIKLGELADALRRFLAARKKPPA